MPGCFYNLNTSPDPYWKEGPAGLLAHTKCNAISGQYDSFIPSFLKNLHTLLHSVCITLHSHQQWKRVFSASSPAFIVCRFFEDGHSDWCEKSFTVILTCILFPLTCFLAVHAPRSQLRSAALRCVGLGSHVCSLSCHTCVSPSTAWSTRCVNT